MSPSSSSGETGRLHADSGWGEYLPRPGLAVPVVGILLAETLIFLASISDLATVSNALWVYLLVLVACAFGPIRYPADTGLFLGFLLVPTFRLVNVGMPRLFQQELLHLLLIYVLFVPATYLLFNLGSIPTPSFGGRTGLVLGPVAVVIGALLAPIEYAILVPEPSSTALTAGHLIVVLAVMAVVGYVEEFIFRGILLETIIDHVGRHRGILLVSVVFAAMHSTSGMVGELVFTFLTGVGFAYLYLRLESLAFVVVAHTVLNTVVFGVLPHLAGGLGPLPTG